MTVRDSVMDKLEELMGEIQSSNLDHHSAASSSIQENNFLDSKEKKSESLSISSKY